MVPTGVFANLNCASVPIFLGQIYFKARGFVVLISPSVSLHTLPIEDNTTHLYPCIS